MTRSRLALGAALLTAASFAAGHLTASLDTNPRVTSTPGIRAVPPAASPTARAVVPKPDRPQLDGSQPDSLELSNPSDCSFGGPCFAEKDLLMPLRG